MIYGTIAGNLGKDAELRTIPSGKQVLNFSVAAKNGRDKDATLWVRCAIWGQRGEKLAPFLTKGSKVTVMGVVTTREHDGKTYVECDVQELVLQGGGSQRDEGTKRTTADVAADEIPF